MRRFAWIWPRARDAVGEVRSPLRQRERTFRPVDVDEEASIRSKMVEESGSTIVQNLGLS